MQSVPTPGTFKRFILTDKWRIASGGGTGVQEQDQQPGFDTASDGKQLNLLGETSGNNTIVEATKMLLSVEIKEKLTPTDQDIMTSLNSIKREQDEAVNEVESDEDRSELGKYNFELLPEHNIHEREGNKSYRCDVCGGTYRHAFSLKRHYLRTHINYIYLSSSDISNCNITLSYAEEMARDEYQTRAKNGTDTTMLGLYRCNACSLLFNELRELKHHVLNHPNTPSSKRFPCSQCNMTFSHKQNLVRHSSVHSGEKPYACKYCGKGFPTATNQRRHERIHEGLKPYLCPHCSSHFSQSGDLKKHIRKLHREFFHPCAFCLKYFSKESDLKDHVLSHGQSLEMNYKVLKRKISTREGGVGPRLVMSNGTWISRGVQMEAKSIPQPRFRCSMCRSRFSSRNSLRKHQMVVHEHLNNRTTGYSSQMPSGINWSQPRNGTSGTCLLTSSKFYASVSQNIAQNLQHFIDGKLNNKSQKHSSIVGVPTIDEDLLLTRPVGKNSLSNRSHYNVTSDFHRIGMADMVPINKEDVNTVGEPWEVDEPPESDYRPSVSRSDDECLQCNGIVKTNNEEENFQALDLSVTRVISSSIECQSDKNQPITLYICHACGERFFSLVEIEDHKVNNHPNVICTHLEVEGMKNVPSELFPSHCSLVGALQRCAAPPSVGVDTTILLQCTKCHEAFQKSADLHEHILQCGGHSETVACERYPKRGRPLRRSRRMVLRGMKRELDDEPVKARKTFVQKNKKIKKDEYSWLQNCERPTADRYQTLESETDLMCDGCNRKFKYSSGLERHQKSCLVSESASARVDALKDVRRQHSCKYCLRSFTYMASLKKHMSDFCASKTAQSAKLPSVPSKSMQTILAKKKLRAKKKSRKLRFRFVAKKAVASLAVPVDEESVKTTVGGSSSTMASESNSNSQDVAVAAEVCVNDPSGSTDENVTVDKSDVAPVTSMKQEISTVTVLEDEEQLVTVEVKREKEEDVNKIEDEDEAGEEEEEEENDDEDASQSKEDEEKLSAMQETGQAVAKASLATEVIAKGTHEVAEPKKEGSIKIESDCGSLNVRREQMHTCPNCKRTFTYLANFKKHLNDLCPLRTMETKDNPDSTQKSGIDPREKAGGTGTSAQEAEDQEGVGLVAATPAAPDRPSDIGNEMTGSYVTMLKHRLSHKLKTSNSDNGGATSSDSGKGEPSTPDTSGTNFCGATTRATSCIVTRSSERKRQMTWWRGRKRATTGAYSRKADAGTSSPAIKQRVSPRRGASVTDKAAVSEETEEEGDGGSSGDGGEDDDGDQERENEVDNGHSPRESKAALNRNRAKTVKNNNNNNPESSKTTTLSSSASITDTGSTIQKGFISQCRRMILRKVKESNPCPKSDDDDSLNNTAKEDG